MEEDENIKVDEDIKVDCKKITSKGELICDIDMKNAAEMLRRKIKPSHTKLNVIDKVLDPSQSAEENKSTDGTQSSEENKPSDGTKPTEADSSNKQGCGCFKTTENSEIGNFVAKFLTKNEEN